MGGALVKVTYRGGSRGGNTEGEEIMDAEHFFNEIFDENQFESYKEHYNNLSEDKQAEFRAIFNDEDIMMHSALANMWVTNHQDVLPEAMMNVKEFLANNQ